MIGGLSAPSGATTYQDCPAMKVNRIGASSIPERSRKPFWE